jgi:Uncharacterised protein family UPF0565
MKTLTPDDSSMMKLVSRIKEMYYLDGGHAGGGCSFTMILRKKLILICD